MGSFTCLKLGFFTPFILLLLDFIFGFNNPLYEISFEYLISFWPLILAFVIVCIFADQKKSVLVKIGFIKNYDTGRKTAVYKEETRDWDEVKSEHEEKTAHSLGVWNLNTFNMLLVGYALYYWHSVNPEAVISYLPAQITHWYVALGIIMICVFCVFKLICRYVYYKSRTVRVMLLPMAYQH